MRTAGIRIRSRGKNEALLWRIFRLLNTEHEEAVSSDLIRA